MRLGRRRAGDRGNRAARDAGHAPALVAELLERIGLVAQPYAVTRPDEADRATGYLQLGLQLRAFGQQAQQRLAGLHRLAGLKPRTLAAMHGSAFIGDGAKAIADFTQVLKEVLRKR